MILHTFGDSHRCSIKCSTEGSNVTFINHNYGGAFTMARFSIEKLNLINIKNRNVKEGDAVCFCFGEIDCRSHFAKLSNFEQIIDEIIYRYFEAIKLNVEQYENLTTIVFNVVPPIKVVPGVYQHPEFPHQGTDEERKKVVLYMNSKLKEYCEKYNYLFFNNHLL